VAFRAHRADSRPERLLELETAPSTQGPQLHAAEDIRAPIRKMISA